MYIYVLYITLKSILLKFMYQDFATQPYAIFSTLQVKKKQQIANHAKSKKCQNNLHTGWRISINICSTVQQYIFSRHLQQHIGNKSLFANHVGFI